MADKDGRFTYSSIKSISNAGNFDIAIYPNPVHQNLTLSFNTEKVMDVQIDIVNVAGKTVYTQKIKLPYGASIQIINVAALSNGHYFLKCIRTDRQTGLKLIKQ